MLVKANSTDMDLSEETSPEAEEVIQNPIFSTNNFNMQKGDYVDSYWRCLAIVNCKKDVTYYIMKNHVISIKHYIDYMAYSRGV